MESKQLRIGNYIQDKDTKIRIDHGLGCADFYCEFYFMDGEIINHAVWE